MKRIVLFVAAFSVLTVVSASAQERGWAIEHRPAAATQATISQAASASAVHVADCVTATFVGNASLAAASQVTVVLRDGASGAGTVKWSANMAVPAVAGTSGVPIALCGLQIKGTLNTAMTLEFTAAGGANSIESVALRGHDEK